MLCYTAMISALGTQCFACCNEGPECCCVGRQCRAKQGSGEQSPLSRATGWANAPGGRVCLKVGQASSYLHGDVATL